jgi:hypothetical protein
LEDVNDVEGTHGPVGLQAAPVLLLGEFGGTIGSLDGLLNGRYPLVREVQQRNEGGHDDYLLLVPAFS